MLERKSAAAALTVLIGVLLCASPPARALPLYAARTGFLCSQCHVNPTGAGLRNAFGFIYLQNGHSLTPRDTNQTTISNRLGDFVTVGTDSRLMGYTTQATNDVWGLFLMQGALYVAADLPHGVSFFYNNDLGKTRDAFVVFRELPAVSYVKIGKFKPPYGLKLDDHTSYTRSGIGFGQESQDLGVEVGYEKMPISVIVAGLNGNPGPGASVGAFDQNAAKAVSAKAEYLRRLPYLGPARVGGSYYWNNLNGVKQVRYGGYGTLQVQKYVTLLGELDQAVDNGLDPNDPASFREGHSAAFAQAVAALTPDLNLSVKYDLDYRVEGDYERYSLGGNWFFTPFAELRVDYRWNIETPSRKNPGLLTARRDNDAYVQLHVAF